MGALLHCWEGGACRFHMRGELIRGRSEQSEHLGKVLSLAASTVSQARGLQWRQTACGSPSASEGRARRGSTTTAHAERPIEPALMVRLFASHEGPDVRTSAHTSRTCLSSPHAMKPHRLWRAGWGAGEGATGTEAKLSHNADTMSHLQTTIFFQ